MDPQMSLPHLQFTALCLVLTGGCTSAAAPGQGNPFDEPVRAGPFVAVPQVRSVERRHVPPLLRAPSAPVIPAIPAPAPVLAREPDVQVFAVTSSPGPVAAEVLTAGAGQPDSRDEILDEAHRVGGTGDVSGEIDLLTVAGYRGNAQAFYELARIHLNGEGIEKSPEAAIAYLNTAMGMGHAESARVLGWLYVMGTGVAVDLNYGKSLLSKAAESSVRAQREFGMALVNLRPPHLNDIEQGLDMLRLAAAAGDSEAAASYAAVFSDSGAPSAPAAAITPKSDEPRRTLKERAFSGDVSAMYDYALAISLGRIPDRDAQFTAYCWYSVAAARGHAQAAFEARSLDGVRTIADRAEPGKTDRRIADITALLDGAVAGAQ